MSQYVVVAWLGYCNRRLYLLAHAARKAAAKMSKL
jgi:hypothetical protein